MALILRKGLLLVLVVLLVSCCTLGCKSQETTKTAPSTLSAPSAMSAPSTMATETREQPKTWGDDTRQDIMKGQ